MPSPLSALKSLRLRTPPRQRAAVRSVSQRRRSRQFIAVAFATFLGLHLAMMVAAEYSRLVRDPVYADKERKLMQLERSLPAATPLVVFFGTSRTAFAFDAGSAQTVLRQSLGRPCAVFNWGIAASGPGTHVMHLRRCLADGHRPALILLEIHPPTLAELPDGALESRFATGAALEWSELDRAREYGFVDRRFAEERREVAIAPWYALRCQILGRLMPSALPYTRRFDGSRGADPCGWIPLQVLEVTEEERVVRVGRAAGEYRGILSQFRLGSGPVRALREFIGLCREENIPVTLVWMPEGPSFRSLYPRQTLNGIVRSLSELAHDGNCRLVSLREWLPEQAFMDGHHLFASQAAGFSERLAREVIEPSLR